MNAKTREKVLRLFSRAYFDRYGRTPPLLVVGVVSSILIGELQVMSDEPVHSPLREIVPLLKAITGVK